MLLIKCQYGTADGHVGRYELDRDRCVTIGFEKYVVTSEEVETPEGVARIARLIWD